MYDVRQEEYAAVIREMIRHENDVTNHRIMWLLIAQGFIANAFASAQKASESFIVVLSLAGILVTLSAFVSLYKSYKARGYLQFLGERAKTGKLEAVYLPLLGWPRKRIKNWWKEFWFCSWFRQIEDAAEPWVFLPGLFILLWLGILLQHRNKLDLALNVLLAGMLTAVILAGCCNLLSWSQERDER